MIELIDVRKKLDSRWVTDGLNLTIPVGKLTCIVGRSGEGKSVLLKEIIGLIRPDSGSIIVDGVDINKLSDHRMLYHFKHFGYVFQFAALLDSLNVFENVAIAQIEAGIPAKKLLDKVRQKLSLVNLGHETLHKFPSQLSGGMRKRVGLARTLMNENLKAILYDEPTTGLDPITSRVIHELIAQVHKEFNITSVIISHDIEIFKYVDYVALLHEGKIKFFGEAKTIWESDNPYIYQFIRGLPLGPIQHEIAYEETKV